MNISQDLLLRLAEVLPKLDETGVAIKQIEFAGHTVFLRIDENGSHHIQDISEIKEPQAPTMRTSSNPTGVPKVYR